MQHSLDLERMDRCEAVPGEASGEMQAACGGHVALSQSTESGDDNDSRTAAAAIDLPRRQ